MVMNLKWLGIGALALATAAAAPAQSWRQVGPPGGTVISLEADPRDANKLYLGTSDGHVFTSTDEGAHWQLLSRIGIGQDDVITHILVDQRDSKRLYATTWTLYSGGGGVYRSNDSGRTWQLIGLAHENVRAIAQAETKKNIFVVGAVSGVYRSTDDGNTWERITPEKHADLRNFDSIAIDPRDENIIYAGTYHLPWKTTDGGKNWFNIGKGMIDDSDVMSVIVDPANPDNVHATACSGIYHSANGASQWTRYNGIPFVFRRTQLIKQDPQHPDTLYAGTTSGLWKTTNEGGEWKRMTPGDWVINAIILDAKNPQRVILGTEREGVQISENGGETYAAANVGFHHQHILDVAMDRDHPERALVVLTFDTNAFLATKDGGTTWAPLGAGLKRTDLKHVYAAPTGWWASLNNGGLMKYDETSGKWVKAGLLVADAAAPAAVTTKGKKTATAAKTSTQTSAAVRTKSQPLALQVNDMAFASDAWFAATTSGILVSRDHGATWKSASKDQLAKQPAQSLEASASGSQVWAISQNTLLYSSDGGAHWDAKDLSFATAGNLHIHRVNDDNLFITTNVGLYASKDAGRTWNRADIRDLQFQDAAGSGGALVVALHGHGLLASLDGGKSYQRVSGAFAEGYVPAVRVRRDGTVIAASATEGLMAFEPDARSADSSNGGGMAALAPTNTMSKPRK